MAPQPLPSMATKCQSVLDASTLNARGHPREFGTRARLVTPFRCGLSGVAAMATEHGASLADLPHQCNDLWHVGSSYKGVYKQWRHASGPELFRHALCHLMGQLTMTGLGFEASQAFRACQRRGIQDGSAFALHEALAQVFPGRFNTVKPAAVALHCPLDGLQEAPSTIALRPDPDAARDYRPTAQRLRGDVCLADRGSLEVGYVRDMDRSGGFFLVRATAGWHPRVLHAVREDGQRRKSCQERDLQAMTANFSQGQRAEREGQWRLDGQPFRWRLIVPWHPDTKSFDDLFTNFAQDSSPISIVCLGDTLRWQVELLFKEWKSHTNLHKFATEKETISEALIWASLAASALKRCLAHAAERLLEGVSSTRQAAMHSASALPELCRALRDGDGPWYRRAFRNMRRYVGRNATRAHPKRDVRTGRAPLGLKSVFQLSEN